MCSLECSEWQGTESYLGCGIEEDLGSMAPEAPPGLRDSEGGA